MAAPHPRRVEWRADASMAFVRSWERARVSLRLALGGVLNDPPRPRATEAIFALDPSAGIGEAA